MLVQCCTFCRIHSIRNLKFTKFANVSVDSNICDESQFSQHLKVIMVKWYLISSNNNMNKNYSSNDSFNSVWYDFFAQCTTKEVCSTIRSPTLMFLTPAVEETRLWRMSSGYVCTQKLLSPSREKLTRRSDNVKKQERKMDRQRPSLG